MGCTGAEQAVNYFHMGVEVGADCAPILAAVCNHALQGEKRAHVVQAYPMVLCLCTLYAELW